MDIIFKKLWGILFATEELPEFNESIHKYCDECGGLGVDSVAGPCLDCNGNGFVEKSRLEIWQESSSNH